MQQSYAYTTCILHYTVRFLYYRKFDLKIAQPSQYRYTQLQYRFAVISEAPSTLCNTIYDIYLCTSVFKFKIGLYTKQGVVHGPGMAGTQFFCFKGTTVTMQKKMLLLYNV